MKKSILAVILFAVVIAAVCPISLSAGAGCDRAFVRCQQSIYPWIMPGFCAFGWAWCNTFVES